MPTNVPRRFVKAPIRLFIENRQLLLDSCFFKSHFNAEEISIVFPAKRLKVIVLSITCQAQVIVVDSGGVYGSLFTFLKISFLKKHLQKILKVP